MKVVTTNVGTFSNICCLLITYFSLVHLSTSIKHQHPLIPL